MKGDLKKAARLFKHGKYTQLLRLLEPQIFRFRQSHDFFYFVGISCLKTGDLGGAGTYLQRGLGLKPQDTPTLLGLALVHLRREEIQEAISCYLDIIDEDPKNKHARRGLALLRKDASPSRVSELSENGRLGRLMPGRKPLLRPILVGLITAAVASAVVAFLWNYTSVFDGDSTPREPLIEALDLNDVGELVDLRGEYRYILTEKAIEDAFIAVKSYFSDFQDNLARRGINRILGSNASQKVKEQARTVASYLSVPDFTTIRDSFTFEDVTGDPFLYDRTYVVWKGKLSNLQVNEDRISFDLLVGYENNEVLLGIARVVVEFAALLDQGDAVEVLGQVHIDESGQAYLKAVSIHKLLPKSGS